MTAYSLAKAVGDYLDCEKVERIMKKALEDEDDAAISRAGSMKKSNQIRARTARRWLNKLGLSYKIFSKSVYLDGHEREDVVEYRKQTFLPQWVHLRDRRVIHHPDGSWSPPPTLKST